MKGLAAQGDLAGALKSYRDSRAIRERLAKSDPANAGWQRDLAESYDKVGNVQAAQGDLAGALKSYRDRLAIMERLAKSDPGNAGWQRDLAVSYAKVAQVILPARSSPTAIAPPSWSGWRNPIPAILAGCPILRYRMKGLATCWCIRAI